MTRTLQNERCTRTDYRRLFAGSAEPLHWLSYTLTGDEELGEKILEAGLEGSLTGAEQVFREWMVSWARRLIIKACIQTMRPWTSELALASYPMLPLRLDAITRENLAAVLDLPSELLQQRLLGLDVLARFVFVLRALEGYSRRDTSLLLNIDDRTCEWVFVRAADQLHASDEAQSEWLGGTQNETASSFTHVGN